MMFAFIVLDYWWVILPGVLLGFYAQMKVTSTYNRFTKVPCDAGITGAQAAREMLDRNGLHEVEIVETGGHLSDHYDPTHRRLALSSENYHGRSISALGVAAHEAGHALQHRDAYAPLHARMALVPITQFASTATTWIFIGGMFLGMAKLATFGVIAFGVIALFQLITLPVEFNASSRARRQLMELGLISNSENREVGKVLNAAALTYVAAMVSSLLYLLQFALMASQSDD